MKVVREFFPNITMPKVNYRYKTDKWKKKLVKGVEVEDIITFDIETTNGYIVNGNIIPYDFNVFKNNVNYDKNKVSTLWLWMVAYEETRTDTIRVYMGRSREELLEFIDMLSRWLYSGGVDRGLNSLNYIEPNKTLPVVTAHVYVHNLGFEFESLRSVLYFSNVFARKRLSPMKASLRKTAHSDVLATNFTFHDTLCLTQKSLESWGKDENLAVQKLQEPADFYDPIRHPKTELTPDEWNYGENDVVTMVYGMQKYRTRFGTLENIPMTQTGIVRKDLNSKMYKRAPEWTMQQAEVNKNMTYDMFKMMTRVYAGGWTHANARYVGQRLNGMRAFDLSSSYPSQMCLRTFPVSSFEPADKSEWSDILAQDINATDLKYHYIVSGTAYGVRTKLDNTFVSSSKVRDLEGEVIDNGRIASASSFSFEFCDLDYDLFTKAYDIDDLVINEIYISESGFLPAPLVNLILDYYSKKTTFKGVAGKESQYVESKEFINSIYGVSVTKLVDDIVEYDELLKEWILKDATVEDFAERVDRMSEKNTAMSYQIGVWVAAWGRYSIWDIILKMDTNVVYCDTDSVKGFFFTAEMALIDDFNARIEERQEYVSKMYNIPVDKFRPTAPNGKQESLGVFDEEDALYEFKTLGAKRYLSQYYDKNGGPGKMSATVAGLPKKAGKLFKDFDDFYDGRMFEENESCKKTAFYYEYDEDVDCLWVDRDGVEYSTKERNGVVVKSVPFQMNMAPEFIDYLDALQNGSNAVFNRLPKILQ